MPVGEVDDAIDPLIEAYQRSYENISSQLTEVVGDPKQRRKVSRLREVRASIDRELTYLDKEVAPRAVQATYWSNELGFASGAVGAGAQTISWDLIDRDAAEILAKGLYTDLLEATSLTGQTSKSLLRKLGRGASLDKLLEGRTAVQAGQAMARQAKGLGVYAVTYANGARHGLDEYAAMSMRTVTANAYNGALVDGAVAEKCKWFEIFDGPDCGLTFHEDPQIADGLIVDDDTARTWRISHPNCRRSFGPRPDINNKKEAERAQRSTSSEQRADQLQADRERGLPVRPEAERAALERSRGPVQRPAKANQPHRTSKAASAAQPAPRDTFAPVDSGAEGIRGKGEEGLRLDPNQDSNAYRQMGEIDDKNMTDSYRTSSGDRFASTLPDSELPAHLRSLEAYQTADYERINEAFRRRPDTLQDTLSADRDTIENVSKRLDRLIESSPRTPENMQVFRGVEGSYAGVVRDAPVGTTLTDKGYTSVTLGEDVIKTFTSHSGRKMIVEVPRGSQAAYMNGNPGSRLPREFELLLARGAQTEVVEQTEEFTRVRLVGYLRDTL